MNAHGLSPIASLLEKLTRMGLDPKETGPGQWEARCPAHEGKRRNLSVKENSDGTLLLHCHRRDESGAPSCAVPAVMRALGLTLRDLFPATPGRTKSKDKAKSKPFPTPEAAIAALSRRLGPPSSFWRYQATDAGHTYEVMRVYRFDASDGTKTYRPLHASGDGWYLGDPEGLWPLYHLPEVQSASKVVVVEGEKSAELVTQLGLVATTSPHGASSAPTKTDWSPLKGKDVCIVPDNDPPGEGYALAVAAHLVALDPPARVKIVRLPLTVKGDDVEQWIRDSVPDSWDLTDCRVEIEKLWAQAPAWVPPHDPPPRKTEPPNLTEWGNAKRIIAANGRVIRFVYRMDRWMVFDKGLWAPDETGLLMRMAKQLPKQVASEASASWDEITRKACLQWALQCERKKILQASIDLAWSEPGIGVMPDAFDKEPFLINTPSGSVDLTSSTLSESRPEHMMSKITSVPFAANRDAPLWRKTLLEVFDGDEDLIAYLQRSLGYSLTADTSEHCMFMCYGSGRNGKNTILDTVRSVIGDYATVADPRVFLSSGQGDHPAGLADLVGRRLVMTSEVDDGQALAEGLVKRVTGDKSLKTRFMHQNFFEFDVTFKLWMLVNDKPKISKQEEGIWSRIRIIPFNVFIPAEKRIKGLSQRLITEEGPGILAWLVEGVRDWAKQGLNEPQSVVSATRDYREEQDTVADWLNETCVCHIHSPEDLTEGRCRMEHGPRGPARVRADALYELYTRWAARSGVRELMTKKKLGDQLSRKGYTPVDSNGARYRGGISIKPSADESNVNLTCF